MYCHQAVLNNPLISPKLYALIHITTMSPPVHRDPLNEEDIEVSSPITNDVEELSRLMSTAALASEEELEEPTPTRDKFRTKLQERWRCNTPHHGVCLSDADTGEHFPLSERQIKIWVNEWVSD